MSPSEKGQIDDINDEILYWKYFEYFLPRGRTADEVCHWVWRQFQELNKNYSLRQILALWLEQAEAAAPKPLVRRLMHALRRNEALRSSTNGTWPLEQTELFLDVFYEYFDFFTDDHSHVFEELAQRMNCEGYWCSAEEIESHWLVLLATNGAKLESRIDGLFNRLYGHNESPPEAEVPGSDLGDTKPENALTLPDTILYWKYFEFFLPRCKRAPKVCEKIWEEFQEQGKTYTIWQLKQLWYAQVQRPEKRPFIRRLMSEFTKNGHFRSLEISWSNKHIEMLLVTFNDCFDPLLFGRRDIFEELWDKLSLRTKFDDDFFVNTSSRDLEDVWKILLRSTHEKHKIFQGQIEAIYRKLYKVEDFGSAEEIQQVLDDFIIEKEL